MADQRKVKLAGGLLVVLGIVLIVLGTLVVVTKERLANDPDTHRILTLALFGEGILTACCGLGTLRSSSGWALAGLILAGLGLSSAVMSGNAIGIVIRIPLALAVGAGYASLKRMNTRIAAPQQANPLTQYYHHFVPLLGAVMQADQHSDRREQRRIREQCRGINISPYELQRLIRVATTGPRVNIDATVKLYLGAARRINLPSPEEKLMVGALTVAGADGLFVPQELETIRAIGRAAGLDDGRVEALIQQHEVKASQLTPERARELLNLHPSAAPHEIDQAHQDFLKEFDDAQYDHLGPRVRDQVAKRREVVTEAHRLLSTSTAPTGSGPRLATRG